MVCSFKIFGEKEVKINSASVHAESHLVKNTPIVLVL